MTRQDAFDKAVAGILAQGCAAVNMEAENGRCQYRTADGRKCAVGQLLTDDQVAALDEGQNPPAWHSSILDALGMDYRRDDDQFLISLQQAHDQAAIERHVLGGRLRERSPEEFRELFRTNARVVAALYGLSTEVLDR